MPDGAPSTALIVASTAAISCAVTALAAVYLFPKHLAEKQQNDAAQEKLQLHTLATSRGACLTPEPCSRWQHSQQPCMNEQQQEQSLFSPVNVQKRPDPYDPKPRSTYLSWDDYFMAVAFLSAERSKDPNKQVGACIVNDDNIILSIGYNGFPRGCPDSQLPWAKRAESGSILDTKYPYVVHAEANALLNKNQAHVTGSRIYVTLFPCNECAKLLIQAGIKEVVYHEAKLEPTGKRPGTMEQAAAAEAAADAIAEAEAAATGQPINVQLFAETDSSNSNGSSSGSSLQSSSSCNHCRCNPAAAAAGNADQEGMCSGQDGVRLEHQSKQKQKKNQNFSVGATADLDASYVASQRLLLMAGVKLRQHTLQRSIQLGQHGSSSR